MTTDRAPLTYCANCGTRVSTAGRPPLTGKRFCGKPECRTAKFRADYRLRHQTAEKPAVPTTCRNCGRDLPGRTYRAGDEFGRWCRRNACRAHRDRIRTESGGAQLPDLLERVGLLEETVALLGHAVLSDDERNIFTSRVVCPECGLRTALTGWVHPNPAGRGCKGTLGDADIRRYDVDAIPLAWPTMDYGE